MAAKKGYITPAKGNEVILHVAKGAAGNVRIVEADPADLGCDVTIQVSRELKSQVSSAIGVIVK